MAAGELKDVRWKVTAETWCAIEAEHRITGRDHSEIARGVMHEWAMSRIHAARVTQKLLEAEGITASSREGQP